MMLYELQQNDVISYQPPQLHKQKYKLGEHISIDELAETMLRVIEIKYMKFPWWKFWKRRKYVEEYHLEVM